MRSASCDYEAAAGKRVTSKFIIANFEGFVLYAPRRRAAIFDATTGSVVTHLADATETIGGGGERAQRCELAGLFYRV